MRDTVPSEKLVTQRSSPVTIRARGSWPTSSVCVTACVEGSISETVSSPALTTQIAVPLEARAIGLVPTGVEASTAPDASSSVTALVGTEAATAAASRP